MKPVIDDQYWFDYSKTLVEKGISSRDDAAAKLQTLLVWLWGIYTTGATVGISLSKTSYPFSIILLIASPSVVLILAYWLAVWVQMPIKAEFDPRIVNDIKKAYNTGVETKAKRLRTCISFSFFAAILVASALIAASFSVPSHLPDDSFPDLILT